MLVELVRALQIISGFCWLLPFVQRSPSLFRIIHGRSRGADSVWFVIWFMSAAQLGFIFRWVVFPDAIYLMKPDELTMWAGVYVLSGMCALAASFIIPLDEKGRR